MRLKRRMAMFLAVGMISVMSACGSQQGGPNPGNTESTGGKEPDVAEDAGAAEDAALPESPEGSASDESGMPDASAADGREENAPQPAEVTITDMIGR